MSQKQVAKIDFEIEVYDKTGKLKSKQCKKGDLYLNNFGVWWCEFLATLLGTDSSAQQFRATNGSYYTVPSNSRIGDATKGYSGTIFWALNGESGVHQIQFGESNNAPSVSDYQLSSPKTFFADYYGANKGITRTTQGNKVIVTMVNDYVNIYGDSLPCYIREVGFVTFMRKGETNTVNDWTQVLLLRDTFNEIYLQAGDHIIFTYRFYFN